MTGMAVVLLILTRFTALSSGNPHGDHHHSIGHNAECTPVITLSAKSRSDNYANCDGNYRLKEDTVLNGKPIYICEEKDRFIGWAGNTWVLTAMQYYNEILSGEIKSPFGGFHGSTSGEKLADTSWDKYYVTSASECPEVETSNAFVGKWAAVEWSGSAQKNGDPDPYNDEKYVEVTSLGREGFHVDFLNGGGGGPYDVTSFVEDSTSFSVKSPDNEDITFGIREDGRLSVAFGYSDPATMIIYAVSDTNSSMWWYAYAHYSIPVAVFLLAMGVLLCIKNGLSYYMKYRQRNLNALNIKVELPGGTESTKTIDRIEITDVAHVYVSVPV